MTTHTPTLLLRCATRTCIATNEWFTLIGTYPIFITVTSTDDTRW